MKQFSKRDWREATRDLPGVCFVELDPVSFDPACDDDALPEVGYENMIFETLLEAQEDGVRFLVLVHEPARRQKGRRNGPAIIRQLVRREVWTWAIVRRRGSRFFDEATLVEIRHPPPTQEQEERYCERVYAAREKAKRARELKSGHQDPATLGAK